MRRPAQNEFLSAGFAGCLGYWNGLRAKQTVPCLLDLDPFFPAAMTSNTVAADVSGPPESFSFWALGDKLRDYLTLIRPGRPFADAWGEMDVSNVWQTYAVVKDTGTPHLAAFDYHGPIAGVRSTRELFLPFSSSGTPCISDVLAVVEFSRESVPHDMLGPGQNVVVPLPCRRSGLQSETAGEPAQYHGAGQSCRQAANG